MIDVIVIGVGTFGAAACECLARRGASVLGLEQFGIAHNRGSHHGKSRLFRVAYYEHPDYVPLLKRAYAGWKELESRAAAHLFHETGVLYMGPADSELMAGSLGSARLHGVEHRELSRPALQREFPLFAVPADHVGLYEPRAGFVLPEAAVQCMAALARDAGATILDQQRVLEWSAAPGRVTVRTEAGTHEGKSLVIAAGAWTSKLVADLGVELVVTRQVLGWVRPRDPRVFGEGAGGGGFPCWAIGYDDGTLHYGFPMREGEDSLKIALHAKGPATDPDHLDKNATPEEEAGFRSVSERCLPAAAGPTVRTCVCMYTNSPDSHFIIDRHPRHSNVAIACGSSGHGFKFAPVIGEVLADLAMGWTMNLPVEFLSLRRFAR